MKKKILITLIALASILFTSCFDPIYSTIRTDVKPEKPTVSGFINSIARYAIENDEGIKEDYLFVSANGGLRYKKADNTSHGSWATYGGLPFNPIHTGYETDPYGGRQIMKVAASGTHLYLATVEWKLIEGKITPVSPEIYVGQIKNWETPTKWETLKINTEGTNLPKERTLRLLLLKDTLTLSGFNIFATDHESIDQRKVYLRLGDFRTYYPKDDKESVLKAYSVPTYFELNGTEAKVITANPSLSADIDPVTSGINSAAVISNKVHFFNSPVVTSYNDRFYLTNGGKVYLGSVKDATHTDEIAISTKDSLIDVGKDISSLAICSDALLVGCGNSSTISVGGIKKINLDGNGGMIGMGAPHANAVIQMPSSSLVLMLYNATPSKQESKSILYSAIAYPGYATSSSNRVENIGLWSYYPSRGNWNRE